MTQPAPRKTVVDIEDGDFYINGLVTYPGRSWKGRRIEGLMMNSRVVQGNFDDLNPQTRQQWNYPDGPWDPQRNNCEFIAAMDEWRSCGLLAITLNTQGGSPIGYSQEQPWENTTFRPDGSMRPEYLARLEAILDRADQLGMAVILGYFYVGQTWRFPDEQTVLKAADNITDWLTERRYSNVMIEIANEIDHPGFGHEILSSGRAHELIERVQQRSVGKVANAAGRLLVGTSLCGGKVPPESMVEASDLLLVHGNGVKQPDGIRKLVDDTRASGAFRGQPVVINEDDHFDFDAADNNMVAAIDRHASWGLFDWRMPGEGYDEGYQSVPTNWATSSDRKRGFFKLLREMTGGE